MQAVLVMFRSDGDRRSFSLTRDITVVGRREDCDLRIPLGEVSRKHCRLVRDGESLRLEDLGSSNGTFHNTQRVQEAILSPGDSIQVGPLIFVLQVDGVPADEDLAPMQAQPLDSGEHGGLSGDIPMQPPVPGDAGMQELPTIDEGFDQLEPVEESVESLDSPAPQPAAEDELGMLEPLPEDDLAGFEVLGEDALLPADDLELSDEKTQMENKPKLGR